MENKVLAFIKFLRLKFFPRLSLFILVQNSGLFQLLSLIAITWNNTENIPGEGRFRICLQIKISRSTETGFYLNKSMTK